MRKTILLFVSVLLILCGCATEKKAEQKFVVVAHSQEHLNDGIVTNTHNYSYTYNDVGVVLYSEYHHNGLLISKESYEYDEFGNLVKAITENDGVVVDSSEYKYTMDEEGHILREENYRNGELCFVAEYTYDKKGNELTRDQTTFFGNEDPDWRKYTKEYNRKGELIKKTLHWNFNGQYIVWDYEDGLCVRQTAYNQGNDQIEEYYVNTYDEKGKLIRESQYNAADKLVRYTEYTWDETGSVQTRREYSADGTLQEDYAVFTFDQYGNKIMSEHYFDGELDVKNYYIYEQLLTE